MASDAYAVSAALHTIRHAEQKVKQYRKGKERKIVLIATISSLIQMNADELRSTDERERVDGMGGEGAMRFISCATSN